MTKNSFFKEIQIKIKIKKHVDMIEDFSKYNGEGTPLRRAQLRMLDMLIEIDKICKKHQIEYWLTAGTLLGAVRHQGFIPWDDDLDIMIQHKDLKLLSAVLQQELPKQFVVQDYSTEKKYYIDSLIKVRDRNSFFLFESHKCFKEQGIFIDIIPIEKIPSLKFKRFVHKLNKQSYLRRRELSLSGKSNNIAGLLISPFSRALLKFAHWYSRKSSTNIYGYNYSHSLFGTFEMHFNKEVFFPLKTMKFEGIDFYVPNDADAYLKIAYGDYMKIPTLEKRQIHSTNIKIYD